MATSRLLPKILSDFQFGFYLLTFVPAHATNHMQDRCGAFKNHRESIKIRRNGMPKKVAEELKNESQAEWKRLPAVRQGFFAG